MMLMIMLMMIMVILMIMRMMMMMMMIMRTLAKMDMAVVISKLSQAESSSTAMARLCLNDDDYDGIVNDHDDNEEDDEHLSIEG